MSNGFKSPTRDALAAKPGVRSLPVLGSQSSEFSQPVFSQPAGLELRSETRFLKPDSTRPPLRSHFDSTSHESLRSMRVGELAKRVGKSVRALHLYEELGLLTPSSRSEAGYRLYSEDAVLRVDWIHQLQDMGLSLPEIRDRAMAFESAASAPLAMREVKALFLRKLIDAREQICKLQALEQELAASVSYLDTCDGCAPVRAKTSCTACDQRGCEEHPPVLVAGFHQR